MTKIKNEVEKTNICSMWLIVQAIKANAKEMKITQTNVNYKGTTIGDYEIIIKKLK